MYVPPPAALTHRLWACLPACLPACPTAMRCSNEQIKAPQTICRDRQAAQGAQLYTQLARLYPDSSSRPRLLGPDAGGAISPEYMQKLAESGASLFAYTYHEYSLSRDLNRSSSIAPSQLMTVSKCERKTKGLSVGTKGLPFHSTVQLWAGEAGGSGGGGLPNLTNSFVSGIWYLDSLGLYASTGTQVFCRQDLVGGFYGLLEDGCPFAGLDPRAPECTFYPPVPNPDYFAALAWKKTMGRRVLRATVRSADVDGDAGPYLRSYAHCSPPTVGPTVAQADAASTRGRGGGGVSFVLINTHSSSAINVSMGMALSKLQRLEWHFTSPGGGQGKLSMLNGVPLKISSNGSSGGWQLPSLAGVEAAGTDALVIQPGSYSFVSYPHADVVACKSDAAPGMLRE